MKTTCVFVVVIICRKTGISNNKYDWRRPTVTERALVNKRGRRREPVVERAPLRVNIIIGGAPRDPVEMAQITRNIRNRFLRTHTHSAAVGRCQSPVVVITINQSSLARADFYLVVVVVVAFFFFPKPNCFFFFFLLSPLFLLFSVEIIIVFVRY